MFEEAHVYNRTQSVPSLLYYLCWSAVFIDLATTFSWLYDFTISILTNVLFLNFTSFEFYSCFIVIFSFKLGIFINRMHCTLQCSLHDGFYLIDSRNWLQKIIELCSYIQNSLSIEWMLDSMEPRNYRLNRNGNSTTKPGESDIICEMEHKH